MEIIEPQCAANSLGVANSFMLHLITTLTSNYCNTSTPEMWPKDYGPTALKFGLDTYDFIVIGAGSAGAVVASRLSENSNQKILLLEAGGNPPIESEIPGLATSLLGSRYDWKYSTQSDGTACLAMISESCLFPKGKMLGGSSSMNMMVYVRGNSRDYIDWAEQGNPSWDWETILRYFKLSENFREVDVYNAHGTNGPLNVESFRSPKEYAEMILQASKELSYRQLLDLVDGNYVGFGYLYGTIENGRRFSTAKAYLREARDNLHIIKKAVARKINFNDDKTVKSVSFVIDGKHEVTAQVSKEAILSAGSIESPKLLMLSGIGPQEQLTKHGIPMVHATSVGENLQDHTSAILFLRISNDKEEQLTNILDAIYQQWIHREGPWGQGIVDIGGFINTENSADSYPNIQFAYLIISNHSEFGTYYKPFIRQSILGQLAPQDHLICVYVALLKPFSRGKLELASADYRDQPTIYSNSLADNRDLDTLVKGIRRHLEFEQTETFQKRHATFLRVDLPVCDTFLYGSDDYWRCYVKHFTDTIFHVVGTVKMGPAADPGAIVDEHLRVRGVKGLRVIDASIMPTIVSGNTNAPTIMIGEKGADDVKNSWR